MTLELVKIEEGLFTGNVVFHQYIVKTEREVMEQRAKYRIMRKKQREEEEKKLEKEQAREEELLKAGKRAKAEEDEDEAGEKEETKDVKEMSRKERKTMYTKANREKRITPRSIMPRYSAREQAEVSGEEGEEGRTRQGHKGRRRERQHHDKGATQVQALQGISARHPNANTLTLSSILSSSLLARLMILRRRQT